MTIISVAAGSAALLSLLTIGAELTSLDVSGWGDGWFREYGQFVARSTEFLFGWINLWWMRITALEGHALIVGTVALIALGRIAIKLTGELRLVIPLCMAYFVCSIFVPIVVLPGWWGIVFATLNFVTLAGASIKYLRASNSD